MTDSPANGAAADVPSHQPPDGEALHELRSLILGPEQDQLRALQARVDNFTLRAEDVSAVLPEAIRLRSRQDTLLASAIRGTVEDAMQASIRSNPGILLDVLFQLIGPAIRKAITSTLRSAIDSLNRSLDVSLSARGLKWRLEAVRTGKSFAEIVLLHTLHYRVEQVFLIHRDSGLLLQHAAAAAVAPRDGDLVSGMLTAIQSFIQDSFGVQEGDGLETIHVGELTVWIERGPLAIVAAVVRGSGPPELRTMFQEVIEAIHLEYHPPLRTFQGDSAAFAGARTHLEACLTEQFEPRERHISPAFWGVCAVLLVGLGLWAWGAMLNAQRWTAYLASLRAEPGIVVTTAYKQGGLYRLTGLRDPLAADPQQLLRQAGIDPGQVEDHWETYHALHPPFVLRRAQSTLSPPETVHLSLDGGVLRATGSAPHRWIEDTRRLARLIPGIDAFQHDQLVDTTLAELAALTQQIEQSTLLFRKGSAQLMTGQEESLRHLSAVLRRLREVAEAVAVRVQVNILGHTDATGGEGKNLPLSQERAERILSSLAAAEAPTTGIAAWGIGSREPRVEEVTDEDREMNRRVSFKVILTGTANP
jgi:OOP family OmpA-OmpF porin